MKRTVKRTAFGGVAAAVALGSMLTLQASPAEAAAVGKWCKSATKSTNLVLDTSRGRLCVYGTGHYRTNLNVKSARTYRGKSAVLGSQWSGGGAEWRVNGRWTSIGATITSIKVG
ncbi:hypothetical protein ACFYWY_17085 [Streptomyces sp. NPDC002870]|uniref:hypothetical protein n=1 Tax=Streptomyces sp. NPDC002870 TaxID=3364666 RepID=UPI0036C977A5